MGATSRTESRARTFEPTADAMHKSRIRRLAKEYDAREAYWQRVLRMHREWRDAHGLEQEAAIRDRHLGRQQ